jgi:hypothetical protein
MFDGSFDSGEAAQTGSLVHLGIATFHIEDSETKAFAAIRKGAEEYPEGKQDKASDLFHKYMLRERADKRGRVIPTYIEWECAIEIPCSPLDKTQTPIYITGHVDQVRELQGGLYYMCDHKAGYAPGEWAIKHYASQAAAYMLAVANEFKTENVKGFILRTIDLTRTNAPYWYEFKFTIPECYKILAPVQHRVAMIRNELIDSTPGKHCEYCPYTNYPYCVTDRKEDEKPKPVEDSVPKAKGKSLTTVEELFK